MRVLAATLITVTAACGGGTGGDTHLSDASPSSDGGASDAPPLLHGLLVAWKSNPALPGILKQDLTVTSAMFKIARLQVIGDNGQPMTANPFALTWTTEGAGDPATLAFNTAPSGLYSQVTITIDESLLGTCYDITGTVKVAGVTKPYHIHDRNSLDVNVTNFNLTLAPGGDATATVRVDLKDAISGIDFATLTDQNGTLELDTLDAQMDEFRDRLKEAFKKGP